MIGSLMYLSHPLLFQLNPSPHRICFVGGVNRLLPSDAVMVEENLFGGDERKRSRFEKPQQLPIRFGHRFFPRDVVAVRDDAKTRGRKSCNEALYRTKLLPGRARGFFGFDYAPRDAERDKLIFDDP